MNMITQKQFIGQCTLMLIVLTLLTDSVEMCVLNQESGSRPLLPFYVVSQKLQSLAATNLGSRVVRLFFKKKIFKYDRNLAKPCGRLFYEYLLLSYIYRKMTLCITKQTLYPRVMWQWQP